MENSILFELASKEILTEHIVYKLKNYISQKYSDTAPVKNAFIFADAVNRIIDRNIPKLDTFYFKQMKTYLYRDVLNKSSFEINYADVFKACLHLKAYGHQYFHELALWLSGALNKPVSKEQTGNFAAHVYHSLRETPEKDIEDIILEVEEQLGWSKDKKLTDEGQHGKHKNKSSKTLISIKKIEKGHVVEEKITSDLPQFYLMQPNDRGIKDPVDGAKEINVPARDPSGESCGEAISNKDSIDNLYGIATLDEDSTDNKLCITIPTKDLVDKSCGVTIPVEDSSDNEGGITTPDEDPRNKPEELETSFPEPPVLSDITPDLELSSAVESMTAKNKNLSTPPLPPFHEQKLKTLLAKSAVAGIMIALLTANYASDDIQANYAALDDILDQRVNAVSDTNTSDRLRKINNFKRIPMRATAYDLSYKCCGKTRSDPEYGITFTGTRAKVGRTVAVDPSVIPLGSTVYISFPEKYKHLNGVYIAEDTGKAVKNDIIDIFMGEDQPGKSVVHKKALEFGVQKIEIYIRDN